MELVSLESVPLVELRPYDWHQLLSEFHSCSPREAYRELCRRAACRPSKAVAAMLPDSVGAWDMVEELDLSGTYVGPKGAVPVMELCKRLPCLRKLSVAGNYLQNDSIWFLAQLATYHPCLSEVDISHNEFVSWSGGMCLATAVVQNARLTFVNLFRTSVDTATAEAVFHHTRRNAVAAAVARGRTAPNPTRHPAAIHLRAMRRYFDQVRDPATGGLTRDGLVEGYRERLRTLGRSAELERYRPAFFDDLRARAPSDSVTWEVFLVLVLLDAVEYVDELVSALRRVFLEFNVSSTSAGGQPPPRPGTHSGSVASPTLATTAATDTREVGERLDGFVEVEAFPAIHARLYGEVLRQRDTDALRASMGLESDGCTVNWDEFLFMWYSAGPVTGAKFFSTDVTQLPRRIRPTYS